MPNVLKMVNDFVRKYPGGVYWFRLAKHSKVVEEHLNEDEVVNYAFVAQKNNSLFDVFSTCVVCVTDKRIVMGQKRLLFGYSFSTVTPEMFNDMQVYCGIVFGKITIDTIKETIYFTNVSKKALVEIESEVSTFMLEEKNNNDEERND